jgi:hypothetical protein
MGKIRWQLAGAGVAALCAAVAGCSSGGAAAGSPRFASPDSASWRACTEQVTLASRVGQLRACADYRYAHGLLEVLAAAASYKSGSGYDLPYFTFAFRDPSSGVIDYKFSTPVVRAENVFTHSTGLIDVARMADGTNIHVGEVLQVSLWATAAASGNVVQMASVTLTLYPRGLWCPDLGSSAGYGESTGQC